MWRVGGGVGGEWRPLRFSREMNEWMAVKCVSVITFVLFPRSPSFSCCPHTIVTHAETSQSVSMSTSGAAVTSPNIGLVHLKLRKCTNQQRKICKIVFLLCRAASHCVTVEEWCTRWTGGSFSNQTFCLETMTLLLSLYHVVTKSYFVQFEKRSTHPAQLIIPASCLEVNMLRV